MLAHAKEGGTFLLNAPFGADEVWDTDARRGPAADHRQEDSSSTSSTPSSWARRSVSGARINVIMQTAFFKISGIIPLEDRARTIKDAIKKSYGKARREGRRR